MLQRARRVHAPWFSGASFVNSSLTPRASTPNSPRRAKSIACCSSEVMSTQDDTRPASAASGGWAYNAAMQVSERRSGGVTVLDLKGRLVLEEGVPTLRAWIDRLVSAGHTNIVLNLRD